MTVVHFFLRTIFTEAYADNLIGQTWVDLPSVLGPLSVIEDVWLTEAGSLPALAPGYRFSGVTHTDAADLKHSEDIGPGLNLPVCWWIDS